MPYKETKDREDGCEGINRLPRVLGVFDQTTREGGRTLNMVELDARARLKRMSMRRLRYESRLKQSSLDLAEIYREFGSDWFKTNEFGGSGQKLYRLYQLGLLDRQQMSDCHTKYRVRLEHEREAKESA